MGRELKDIAYYWQEHEDDCVRACVANLLHINPKKLPHPVKEYEEYVKNGGKLFWVRFFNKYYKPFGFRLYMTTNTSRFAIGIVAAFCYKAHAIITLDSKPYWNPDPQVRRAQYQSHQIGYYLKIQKFKVK